MSISLLLLTFAPAPQEAEPHPLQLDRTGLQWVLPFENARAQADRRGRLLLIKPVAFGTSKAGGW